MLEHKKSRMVQVVAKSIESVGVAQNSGTLGDSQQVQETDPFGQMVKSSLVIEPPFHPFTLTLMLEMNTELLPCVDTMEKNIDGFGHRLICNIDLDRSDIPQDILKAVRKERVLLTNFFLYAGMDISFRQLRMNTRRDQEATGNGYWEVIRNAQGRVQYFVQMRSYQARMTPAEDTPFEFEMPILELQEDNSVKIIKIKRLKKFRKYVQKATSVYNASVTSGYVTRWFKEYGDPRVYDVDTGIEIKGEKLKDFPLDKRANEVIHFSLFSPRSPYGVPRYIGALIDMLGDRKASEINYVTFCNNTVPSLAITVSNGELTDETVVRIKDFLNKLQGDDNRSKVLIIEAEPTGEEGEQTGQVKIDIKELSSQQIHDAMYQKYAEANKEKVRVAYRLPPIFLGRCHSEDTEYLTDLGWHKYADVLPGMKLATVNPATGGVEYQEPISRHIYDYDGELLHLLNRGIDALVTPNHRLWTRPTVFKERFPYTWRFVEACELRDVKGGNAGYLELPVSASWEGEILEPFEIPRNDSGNKKNTWEPGKKSKNLMRDLRRYHNRDSYRVDANSFLKFIGYFVSEGSASTTPGPIQLSQNRGPIADDMVSTIKNMGFKVKTYASKSRPDQLNIAFCHIGFWKWIRENCGTYSDNKRIPNFILGASREQLKTLLFAMIQGDGSWHKHGSQGAFSYHTTSKKLNDQLHEICLKLGIALVTRAVDRSKEGWKTIYISSGHFDHKHLIHPDTQISFVSYSGRVSCFTVPNGLLVTRRNGRVLISGNSSDYNRATSDTARKLADEQVFAPERDEFDDFINRILFPEMGVVYHSFRSNSPNTTDNSELVQILSNAEKTGGMTPRRADLVLRDILGRDLPPFAQDENFNLDLPFSLSMAEAVKNKADAAEPGQQVTALKRLQQIDGIVGGGAGGAEVAKTLLAIRGELERQWAELNIVPNHKHDE